MNFTLCTDVPYTHSLHTKSWLVGLTQALVFEEHNMLALYKLCIPGNQTCLNMIMLIYTIPWTVTLWEMFTLLSPWMHVMTVPFSAGKVRMEVKFPLTTPTGCARKFPVTCSVLPGATVSSPPGNPQKTSIPGRVHWRTTSLPEHGKSCGDCCVKCISL